MNMKHLMTGADPEGFAVDKQGNVVPAPMFFYSGKGESMVHFDNACMEVAIPPSSTEDEFVSTVLAHKKMVDDIITGVELTPSWVPSVWVPEHYLNEPILMQAGCDPDYNVYTRKQNPRPQFTSNLRSAGGHVHISYEGPKTPVVHRLILKNFELRHGLVSTLYDQDRNRSSLYGKSGSYRPKEYGLEIRSPSNWWLDSEELIRFTWRCAKAAVENMSDAVEEVADAVIQNVLNNRDQAAAYAIMEAYKLEIPA